ncbi:sulfite exporter TauE/SafE family protein [Alicyclobacillus sp. ALC3]|uniref:sulfite exporter TauE/SafE family protein n=1 Tax=Alicyclobacillus sp. ALC3 TaxID=2796143 RepID=UPI0023787556|nr:sulfite exporter TauE/SafE family protein [Alicyclobacillus sp. ALC3]WDL98366.1 sulfite exporter TauE/SafE family protein [Alicyclobacillus sp. ALC3]
MSISLVLAAVLIVFLGALTRTVFGFGEAVVSMPLLALLPVHLHTSVSLVGLVGLTIASLGVTFGWRHVNRRELLPLITAAVVGIPVGLTLVNVVPEQITTGILGIALSTYGIYSLTRQFFTTAEAQHRLHHPVWGFIFGFSSGVFGSAYNFNGVPVAIYGSLRGWHPHNFRSTMQAYFFMSGTLIVAGQGISGMWNADVFRLYLFSLPAMVAAFLAGTTLNRRVSTTKFQRYVFLLIALLGVLLFVKSVA